MKILDKMLERYLERQEKKNLSKDNPSQKSTRRYRRMMASIQARKIRKARRKMASVAEVNAGKAPAPKNTRIVNVLPDNGNWNPLKSFPRNLNCFCGSKSKAKHCCLPFQPAVLETDMATLVRLNWDKIVNGEEILPPAPGSPRACAKGNA